MKIKVFEEMHFFVEEDGKRKKIAEHKDVPVQIQTGSEKLSKLFKSVRMNGIELTNNQ
jgi:hypothetical protein